MSNETMSAAAAATSNRIRIDRFLAVGAVAGVIAAAAAHLSTLAAIPVWAMFMGWVAYFTRGHSARDGLINYLVSRLACSSALAR